MYPESISEVCLKAGEEIRKALHSSLQSIPMKTQGQAKLLVFRDGWKAIKKALEENEVFEGLEETKYYSAKNNAKKLVIKEEERLKKCGRVFGETFCFYHHEKEDGDNHSKGLGLIRMGNTAQWEKLF